MYLQFFMWQLTPEGSNLIRNEMYFFNLTPAGSHNRSGTNADAQRRCATPLGLGYFFFANKVKPLWGLRIKPFFCDYNKSI
jgi:hypothetical protein